MLSDYTHEQSDHPIGVRRCSSCNATRPRGRWTYACGSTWAWAIGMAHQARAGDYAWRFRLICAERHPMTTQHHEAV